MELGSKIQSRRLMLVVYTVVYPLKSKEICQQVELISSKNQHLLALMIILAKIILHQICFQSESSVNLEINQHR